MRQKESAFNITRIAGEDLTLWQYKPVSLDANGAVVKTAAAAGALGILQYPADNTESCTIRIRGKSKGYTGASLNPGAHTHATDGEIVAAVGTEALNVFLLEPGVAGQLVDTIVMGRIDSDGANITDMMAMMPIEVDLSNAKGENILKEFTPGFVGRVASFKAVVLDVTTDALLSGKTLDFELYVNNKEQGFATTRIGTGTSAVRPASVGLNIANDAFQPEVLTFNDDDTISLICKDTGTNFTDGKVAILLIIQY